MAPPLSPLLGSAFGFLVGFFLGAIFVGSEIQPIIIYYKQRYKASEILINYKHVGSELQEHWILIFLVSFVGLFRVLISAGILFQIRVYF